MERELLLLGLLRRQKMHGYELHEFIEQYMQTCVDLKKSTAYYLLDKLAQKGYVSQSVEQSGNRPPRHVYHITPVGEARFQELLRENLASHVPVKFGDLVGLAFLDDIPAEEAIPLLQKRQEALARSLETAVTVPPHPGSLQLVIQHQTIHLETEIAWLDSVINSLKS
ncbi:MAG: PadR family transcriptional regulator [Chloroflexi bacterium]|nr:PadR family transcriptional regulator [Chloroflexota bacterium]